MALNLTFKAISDVPGNVMQWIGGRAGSNSNMADQLGDNAKHMVAAGAYKVGAAVEGAKTRSHQSALAANERAQRDEERLMGQVADNAGGGAASPSSTSSPGKKGGG